MDIKRKYNKIFTDLFASEHGLLAYTLHSRYGIKPSESLTFINAYVKEQLIVVDDEYRIRLTEKGREVALNLNKLLAKTQLNDPTGTVVHIKKTSIFAPYIPRKEFCNYIKEREVGETSK